MSTKPTTDRRLNRWYYRLMDVSLVTSLILFAIFIAVRGFGYDASWMDRPAFLFVSIPLALLSLPLAMVLVLARFMRDEYAEQLFQRTVAVMVYLVAAVPFIFVVSGWTTYYIIGGDEAPWIYSWFSETPTLYAVLKKTWEFFMLMFVVIFQILRWKDSR